MKDKNSIRNDLEIIIKKYHLEKNIDVSTVIGWVANEDEPDSMKSNREYQQKWFMYLEKISDVDDINYFIEVFTDIWNYFPHKSLNGLSPIELINARKK